jgi:ubiquinone/menaquinone biosynthesis C-methylase UbiE
MRPYTRSMDVMDYVVLQPRVTRLSDFESDMVMNDVPYRQGQHPHRLWEYSSILQQLDELRVVKDARILDVGSGGSVLPPFLQVEAGFTDVTLTDSMVGGDISGMVLGQETFYGIRQPLLRVPVEKMTVPSDEWDVTMCISVIEHVVADQYQNALRELCRVTKPGGFIFITSDYFRDAEHAATSPFKDVQHTAFTKETVLEIPSIIDVEFVGETDLDYRGDFVHNYSFCNIVLRKRQHPLGANPVSTEKA